MFACSLSSAVFNIVVLSLNQTFWSELYQQSPTEERTRFLHRLLLLIYAGEVEGKRSLWKSTRPRLR